MPRKRVFTSAKQVKINKARKSKIPLIKVQQRSILVLISSSYKNWIPETNTPSRRIIVHAIKAKEEAQIILDNYYKAKDKFDAVVLSPAHGAKTSTKISWSVLADYNQLFYTLIGRAAQITNHVHLCTCYQGLYIPSYIQKLVENELLGVRVSGFQESMLGAKFYNADNDECEEFSTQNRVLKYVQFGCLYKYSLDLPAGFISAISRA
jgi:hypothetical protein